MYADSNLKPILDQQQYVGLDGTKYPSNFPKSLIPELRKVAEVQRPIDPSLVVTGFIIDSSLNQVWLTQSKTQEQIDSDNQLTAPDLATQLATALLANGTINSGDLQSETLSIIGAKSQSIGSIKISK